MAQGRVTDFFSARKNNSAAQPSKRRKVEISTSDIDISSLKKTNVNPYKNLDQDPQSVDTRKENVFSPLQTRAARKSNAVKLKTPRPTTRSRKTKVDPKQKLLPDVLANSPAPIANEKSTKIADAVTSSWDEHDGPACTPSKSQDSNKVTTKGRKRDRDSVKTNSPKNDATPDKRPEATKSPQDSKARKKLLLKSKEKTISSETLTENVEFSLPKTPPPISPLPPTPPVQAIAKKSQPKMSAAVMEAMERCKSLSAKNSTSKTGSVEEMKEKLTKCGKLEELKSQLSKMQEVKAKLKTPVPKLEKFDKMTVEVETASEPKQSVPAYEKFHSLATPAAPSLTLPYKYKLIAETFRGMDTVVSMLHNRNEICTFSKLKTAVQSMNKKNFELKHIGQIKTVYPTAYELRQEKGLPMFGGKTSDYQLTVEANLDEDKNKSKKPTFSASHLVARRSNFHNKLIQIVKHHHKEFLASLSRPLPAPDNITRWHPKFPVDQVPDIEPSPLPEPPHVKTYQSAKDVLEDTRGKLMPKVEKALEETARELEKSQKKPDGNAGVTSKPSTKPATSGIYKGVPQALLDKPGKRQRNKILDENDIPLTMIDTIHQETMGGKRKKLSQGHTTSSQTKFLEIQCKDFRIHTFSFRFTPKAQNKQFVNVIVHHAFPTKDSLLFAYEYGLNSKLNGRNSGTDTPIFDCQSDWQMELERCGCGHRWRVTTVNSSFQLSVSLPQYFVIPATLSDADIQRAAPQFNNRRVPTWCYTHINGISLVRMAVVDPNTDLQEQADKMITAIKVAGDQKNSPTVIDLGEHCPTCKDVQESFAKLKKLCLCSSMKDFLIQDQMWLSNLDDTKWLQLVAQCLTAANFVSEHVSNERRRNIVIKEQSGYDFSCVVSSLVMIYLDPYFRTRVGFQALIQREWVKMGHPFQKYLVLVSQADCEQVPIFLLFLDCVWQLLQQYPSCFEFTETFLTTLWDTAHLGLFQTFLFNSDHHRNNFSANEGRNILRFTLPSAWLWQLQFENEDFSFFKDPLFTVTHDKHITRALSETRLLSRPGLHSQSLRNDRYRRRLANMYDADEDCRFSTEFLRPQTSAPVIRLWTQCFLRWQVPAQILSGGSPSQYLQQCHMVEEIIHLEHKAKLLQEEKEQANHKRPQSNLIFGYHPETPNVTELLNSTYLTSSFPFCPGSGIHEHQMNFAVAQKLNVYLQNSALEYDKLDTLESYDADD